MKTFTDIAHLRLINQQLSETSIKTPAKMIRWFAAMQGQEYGPTKWSLGLRLPGLLEKDVDTDFTAGKILRTHLLRPTWHLVAAEDIGWLLTLTAEHVAHQNQYMYRQLELDQKIFHRSQDIMIKALQGGKHLTREEINDQLLNNNIEAKGLRLSYIMMQAELSGIICSGGRRDHQFTYALLEERAPGQKTMDREEALAKLMKRYFKSRGPATAADFVTWSGLKSAEVKKGIAMAGKQLERFTHEQTEYYFYSGQYLPEEKQLYLLSIYDEFIMGYKDRSAIMTFKKKFKDATFVYDSMVVHKGQVIGTWRKTATKKTGEISFDFFKPLTKIQSTALDHAVSRMGEFFNVSITYSI